MKGTTGRKKTEKEAEVAIDTGVDRMTNARKTKKRIAKSIKAEDTKIVPLRKEKFAKDGNLPQNLVNQVE